jgi:hypothetical protein
VKRPLALLAAGAAALAGCRAEPAPSAAVPPAPRAALLLEPPRIGVGQVAELELAVVTPPGFVPRPWAPPGELPGIWVLASQALPVEKEPARWIHRTRVRLRAQALGTHVWPGGSVELVGPGGEEARADYAELPLEVASIVPELPGRGAPFGVRVPALGDVGPRPVWGPAAAGALAALACVGLVALARRRRRAAREPAAAPAAPTPPPWQLAAAELAAARERAGRGERFAAAHAAARALRSYAERRFGAEALARTSEELACARPPFAATSRWPALVALLRELDALRFLPEHDAAAREALGARLEALLAGAEAFVADSTPDGPGA